MTDQERFAIVGAGLAGAKAAETLRTEGFDGQVLLIGAETERPYDRPPLSKDYLQGKAPKEEIYVHPEGWYAEHDIDLRLDTRVTAFDRATRQLATQSGDRITYDKLLLTTGSSPRRLSVPGHDLAGVLYLREVRDSEEIKSAFATAKRVAIIGAGWIGLETAAAGRAAGIEVSVLEQARLPLVGVLGAEVAEIFAALHTENGVDLMMGVKVIEIFAAGDRVGGVRLADGSHIDADVVVIGVGITPNTELAEMAGLSINDGVLVDEYLRTADPYVFAAGDVANALYPSLGRHLRLEHWSAALNQGPVAATNMMGRATIYDHVPYFFSDQYDLSMEYRGFVEGSTYDRVVFRGDVTKREFIAFWMYQGRVVAGMNANISDAGDAIADLVRSRDQIDATKLADPAIPLEDVIATASQPPQ